MYNNVNSNNKLKFNQIPNILIIKHILFYLNVQSLPYFSLANKKCCSCVKTHMWIRLHFLGNEKKLIEQENEQTIKTIMKKKKNYLIEYELEEPNLTLSKQLIDKIGKEDVLNLKFLYKKPNKKSEILIAPFVLLMGKKPKNLIKTDGTKQISFFHPAKELFSDKYIVNKIKKFQIETIPLNIYREVVEMLKLNDFNTQSLNHYSNEIKHLLEWVKGVIEAHRFIRKYSFSQGELNSLNEEEINFCEEMDMIVIHDCETNNKIEELLALRGELELDYATNQEQISQIDLQLHQLGMEDITAAEILNKMNIAVPAIYLPSSTDGIGWVSRRQVVTYYG